MHQKEVRYSLSLVGAEGLLVVCLNIRLECGSQLPFEVSYFLRPNIFDTVDLRVWDVVNKELLQRRLALEAAGLKVLLEDWLVVLLDALLELI